MAQNFNDIPSTETLTDSRQPLLDRDEAVRSAFSGSTAPSNPVLGQFWFDTTSAPGTLYQCVQVTPSVLFREIPFGNPVAIAQGGTGATTAAGARTALGLGTLATKDASAIDVDLTQSSTGFIKVAAGTDAQRPGTAVNGMLRYSSTQNTFEGYINGQWQPVGSTTYNNMLVQRFDGTGGAGNQNLSLSSNPGSLNNVDVYINGVYQQKNELSLSGTTLTVPAGPVGTGNIEVVYGVPLSIGVPADGSVTPAKLAPAGTAGQVLTSNGPGSAPSFQNPSGGVTSVTGTANQVIASASTGAITLSLPQSIHTGANPQFNSLGVGTAGSGTTGEIRATANVTAYFSSDAAFKENVREIPDALGIACRIGGKLFDWTDAWIAEHGGEDGYFVKREDFGVLGQDVEREFPLATRRRPDGSLAVDYQKLSALALAAVAQLRSEIRSSSRN